MKKIVSLGLCSAVLCLTSCYNTRMCVGNVSPLDPVVEVNEQWNDHFLYGWIPGKNSKMKTADYVNNASDYVVKTNTTFLNGLVGVVTMGIYTPTQTRYYLPLKDVQKTDKIEKKSEK